MILIIVLLVPTGTTNYFLIIDFCNIGCLTFCFYLVKEVLHLLKNKINRLIYC